MTDDSRSEWIAAIDARVRRSTGLADVTGDPVVLEARIVHDDGRVSAHHLVLGSGPARVVDGAADHADVTLTATESAATGLRAGTVNAQECLAAGTLRMQGSPEVLTRFVPDLVTLAGLVGG